MFQNNYGCQSLYGVTKNYYIRILYFVHNLMKYARGQEIKLYSLGNKTKCLFTHIPTFCIIICKIIKNENFTRS